MSEKCIAEASDLASRLQAALRALEGDVPPHYSETEVAGRYDGAWWALMMMSNEAGGMRDEWRAEAAIAERSKT